MTRSNREGLQERPCRAAHHSQYPMSSIVGSAADDQMGHLYHCT